MQADKPFPKEYLKDPKRRAEHRVYRQLAESNLPGLFIFEWKRDKKSAEVDFVVWIRGVGLFAIQVKGGSYQYRRDDDKEWYLRKSGEWETVPSPLQQTWSGADALIHSLPRIQGFRSFVLPVLLFTDMDPDRDIEARADRDKVHPLFGADDLTRQLTELAREREVFYPPTDNTISIGAKTITHGDVIYEPVEHPDADEEDAGLAGLPELGADHVIIRHVEHLHQTINLHLHFHNPIGPEDAALLKELLDYARGWPPGD